MKQRIVLWTWAASYIQNQGNGSGWPVLSAK